MVLSEFVDCIQSADLKQVVRHWCEARRNKIMPAWQDIRPSAIVKQLPIIWSYHYDRSSDEFIGRLAGQRISDAFGKNFRGLPLTDAYPPETVGWISALCRKVVNEPALYSYIGKVLKQAGDVSIGSRIMLPLSSDGGTADGILGATEYGFFLQAPICLEQPAPKDEQWLTLHKIIAQVGLAANSVA